MDVESLIVIVLLLIVVVPVWALIRTFKLKRNSATREELANLTTRIYSLEKQVSRFEAAVKTEPAEPLAAPPARPEPPRVAEPAPRPVAPPGPVAPPPAAQPPAKPQPPPPPAVAPSPMEKVPPVPATKPSTPAAARPRIGWGDLEERLGANWLNKVGTAAFVIGAAFFLNYSMRMLGPAGKIAVLYTLALVLGGLGVIGERRERYRIIARAVLGGGWALAYFTTYAMHNIPEVRLVESAWWGFLLLFVVAAAMVAHSLRYDSEVVTGFAYLLGFASVAVSHISISTLVASAVLATSLIVVLWRRHWYRLEPLAIVATYGVHWAWLKQVRDWYGAHTWFPDFNASVALCTVYWAMFTVSHFLRDEREPKNRNLLVGSFLLNAAGYLAVLRYQSIHPEWRFWFLLVTGFLYLALAAFARRRDRRLGFLLHSTLGASLLVVAFPYRYSGTRLEIFWLVEAEALLFVGWRMAEPHLRKLGWLAAGVLATYVTFHDLSPRLAVWRPPDWPLGWLLLLLAAAFYANARLTPRLLGKDATETDTTVAVASSPVATGFLLATAWVALPFMWAGLVWAVVGVGLIEIGRRLDDRVLRGCGHGAAALAALRLLVINLQYAPPVWGTNLRVLTIGLTVALFYFASHRVLAARPETQQETGLLGAAARRGGIPAAYTWSATTLVALLIWNEMTNAAVALAWGIVGLALVELGRPRGDKPLVAQGHTLLILSLARIFFADLNGEGLIIGPVTQRMVSVGALAAIYYYSAVTSPDETPRLRAGYYWFGTAALVALLRFELPLEWIAVGWAVLTVCLFFVGRRFQVSHLRYQSFLLTLFVVLRCAFDNFYQKAPMWGELNERTVTVTAASLLLYVLLVATLVEKRKRSLGDAVPTEAGND